MPFYNEWVDIVYYPYSPQKINSLEDRLDTVNAMEMNEKNVEYSLRNEMTPGFIKTKDEIVFENGDEFECTYISDFGQVYIWTKFNIWTFLPEESDRSIYLKRHPIFSSEYMETYGPFEIVSKKWIDFCIFINSKKFFHLPFDLSQERFRKQGTIKASRNDIESITFSSYPLSENSVDFIDQFIKPNLPYKLLITKEEFIDKSDRLETMIFDGVCTPEIWTDNYVCIARSYEMNERFIILPRHPSSIK